MSRPKKMTLNNQTEISKSVDLCLRILSYNVAGNSRHDQARMESVSRIIREISPDIGCLHCVSASGFQTLRGLLDSKYILFEVFLEEKESSGGVLLLKRDTVAIPEGAQPYYYDFSVGKGRVLGTEIVTADFRTHILMTDFAAGIDEDNIRAEQFDTVLEILKTVQNQAYVLAGDFNIHELTEPVERAIMGRRDMRDAYLVTGCPENVRNARTHRIYYNIPDATVLKLQSGGTERIKETGTPATDKPYLMAELKIDP